MFRNGSRNLTKLSRRINRCKSVTNCYNRRYTQLWLFWVLVILFHESLRICKTRCSTRRLQLKPLKNCYDSKHIKTLKIITRERSKSIHPLLNHITFVITPKIVNYQQLLITVGGQPIPGRSKFNMGDFPDPP